MNHKLHLGHCLIPIAIAAIAFVALGANGASIGIAAIAILCPLMMGGMMWMMVRNGGEHSEHPEASHDESARGLS